MQSSKTLRSVARFLQANTSFSHRTPQVFASFSQYNNGNGMSLNYSTSVPNDSETHDDFKPIDNSLPSHISLKDVVHQDIQENPVMIYMKGVPDFPQCGFSSLAVKVLKHYNAPLRARNILEDPEMKNAVKAYSHWPTFPQVFIKGEFIGGSDIVLNMHQSGELKEKLKDVAAAPEKSE